MSMLHFIFLFKIKSFNNKIELYFNVILFWSEKQSDKQKNK